MFNITLIEFNPTDSYSDGISIYSNPCVSSSGYIVIFIIAIIAIVGILCAYFLFKLIERSGKWKLNLFSDRHTSMNLTSFRSDHLPEGRENDLLFLKLFGQWIQQVLNTQSPRDILDHRFQGRTDTSDERYNISNRNIYSTSWGAASLTQPEKYRLARIARAAYNNGTLQALGYEIYGNFAVIKHTDSRMIAKSRIALIAILAASDR